MSKLTKTDLKGIVKECLIEILAEGLVGGRRPPANKKKTLKESIMKSKTLIAGTSSQTKGVQRKNSRPTYLDNIKFGDSNKQQQFQEKVNNTVSALTSDPILNEMLADTAATTLQEQIAAESKKGYVSPSSGDAAAKAASMSDPTDMFGNEASSKWAALAFAPSVKK